MASFFAAFTIITLDKGYGNNIDRHGNLRKSFIYHECRRYRERKRERSGNLRTKGRWPKGIEIRDKKGGKLHKKH